MMKKTVLIFLLVLSACASGKSAVTMDSLDSIPIGATKEDVIAQAGDPVKVTKMDDGTEEYLYIERLRAGARLLSERRYIILLKEGRVVSKKIEQSSPLPATFDSYEMQTTENMSERSLTP